MITIDKKIFEKYVPAAKMPERNDSVFGRMQPLFGDSFNRLVEHTLGTAVAEGLADGQVLNSLVTQFVCIDTFVANLRSFDLVLTATGFGIVSTQSTAPASQARVEALNGQLRLQRLRVHEQIVTELISTEGWGSSPQAQRCIDVLFWRVTDMERYSIQKLSADTVQAMHSRALTADTFLRREVSDEYMEELLQHYRNGTLTNADRIIIDLCHRFTGDFVSQEENPCPNRLLLDTIMRQLETYHDQYATYENSSVYKSRHAEQFRNRQEPSFFFM